MTTQSDQDGKIRPDTLVKTQNQNQTKQARHPSTTQRPPSDHSNDHPQQQPPRFFNLQNTPIMSLPKSVKTALRSLDPQTVKTYRRELRSSQKSLVFGFILWLLFGFHYLYLRRAGTQFFFWITLGGFGLGGSSISSGSRASSATTTTTPPASS